MALDQSQVKHASSFKEQFTARAIIIGVVGSIILTCSSMFVALKASSLPWPIMFVALASMFALKAMGNTNSMRLTWPIPVCPPVPWWRAVWRLPFPAFSS